LLIFAFVRYAAAYCRSMAFSTRCTTLTPTSDAKNDFAAVPSFHFGFTMLAAIGIAHVFAFRAWLVPLLALLPAIMLVAIVSTANHFFLDAAAGGMGVLAFWWLLVWRRETMRSPVRDVKRGRAALEPG
jgi:hypothetical protein